MFIDYIEGAAAELGSLEKELQRLDREYKRHFDRQLREEINRVKKDIGKKRREVAEQIYLNIAELRLLKRRFPEFYAVLLDDAVLGSTLKKKAWLFDAKELPQKDIERRLHEISAKRKQLKDAKDFLKKWVGSIDKKSLCATWDVLKGILNRDEMDRDEAITAIDENDRQLRREGWALVLQPPFILKPLNRFFAMLKNVNAEEFEKAGMVKKAQGHGTTAEYNALRELAKARHKRLRLEAMCRHILMANPQFLSALRKQRMTWRDKTTGIFMKDFLDKISLPEIDEKKWVKEMQKKLE